MQGGLRPVHGSRCQAVLHRVEVDVVHVQGEIPVVPDQVLPEAALPDVIFPSPVTAHGHATRSHGSGKARLDGAPAPGIIMIVRRQSPDGVNVIGQHGHRIDAKWPGSFGGLQGRAKGRDLFDQKAGAAVLQGDREEIGRSGDGGSAVVDHG